MIKELGRDEVEIVEDYIYLTREEYPFYFLTDKKPKKYSNRGFLINNSYYVNIQEISGFNFIGLCKVRDKKSLLEIIELFKQLLKEYKNIDVWAFKDNEQIIRILSKSENYLARYGVLTHKIYDEGIIIYRFKEV